MRIRKTAKSYLETTAFGTRCTASRRPALQRSRGAAGWASGFQNRDFVDSASALWSLGGAGAGKFPAPFASANGAPVARQKRDRMPKNAGHRCTGWQRRTLKSRISIDSILMTPGFTLESENPTHRLPPRQVTRKMRCIGGISVHLEERLPTPFASATAGPLLAGKLEGVQKNGPRSP